MLKRCQPPCDMDPWRNGDWRNMKEAVLIGAGQTGRGFIAPILQTNAYHITFIDKNKELIDRLNGKILYRSLLPVMGKEPVTITDYDAYTTADEGSHMRNWHTQI